MPNRESVSKLMAMGPIPDEETISDDLLLSYEKLISSLEKPVSDEEARTLCAVFGVDSAYGLAWALVHLIESAPGWPLIECLAGDGEWITMLRERAERGGLL